MQVYVDGIVIKSTKKGTLLSDLEETFSNLRRYRMKLNPEKCTFGVPADKLLVSCLKPRHRSQSVQDSGY